MNLRKQVEPLLSAALQASSEQRHAHRATSRLALVVTSAQTSLRNHHEQSRSVTILLCDPGRVKTRGPPRQTARSTATSASASSTMRSRRSVRSCRSSPDTDC